MDKKKKKTKPRKKQGTLGKRKIDSGKKQIPSKKEKKTLKKKKRHISKAEGLTIEISKMRGDIKTFIEKFRSDISKRGKNYRLYAKQFQKKKL